MKIITEKNKQGWIETYIKKYSRMQENFNRLPSLKDCMGSSPQDEGNGEKGDCEMLHSDMGVVLLQAPNPSISRSWFGDEESVPSAV